jgi:hypothetical protein
LDGRRAHQVTHNTYTHNAHKPVAITMLWAKTSIQLFITLLYSPLFFFLDYGLSFSIAQ